jgi:hypothetical protein
MNPSIKQKLKSLANSNGKIKKKDLLKVLGSAEIRTPQWISLSDYQLVIPILYLDKLNKLYSNRTFMPSSSCATRYGKFLSLDGTEVILEGIVAQAAMTLNPRNTCFVFCIFKNGKVQSHQADFKTSVGAQESANKEAQAILNSEQLIDIDESIEQF